MKKMFPAATILLLTLLLLAGALAGGCMGQKTNYTLRIIPPRNLEFPLQGSWEIVSLLQDDTDDANDADGTNDTAKQGSRRGMDLKTLTLRISTFNGEHLLLNPVIRLKGQARAICSTITRPSQGFRFKNTEIGVFAFDSHLFSVSCCVKMTTTALNLFNNYLVKGRR